MSEGAEEWRDVPGTEGKYQVSSRGRVRSLVGANGLDITEWRVCKQTDHKKGYLMVSISNKLRLVHDLVLEAFVGPKPDDKMEACHFPDPSRTNNDITNLRWDYRSNNMRDAALQGRIRGQKLTPDKVMDLWNEIKDKELNGQFLAELTQRYPVKSKTIRNIKTGDTWGWLTRPDQQQ